MCYNGSSLGASDHISFSVEKNCIIKFAESSTVKTNYYRGNYVAVRTALSQINWEEMSGMDIHDSWKFFLNLN